jgi:hypothetical protein
MMMQDFYALVVGIIPTAAVIFSVFFALRSIGRFRNWRDGEKQELWIFLALVIGALSMLFVASGLFNVIFETDIALFIIVLGIFMGVAAIGLGTVYYIVLWRGGTEK